MKKTAIGFLILILLAGLTAGCSRNSEMENSTSQEAAGTGNETLDEPSEEPYITGGFHDDSDPDAPKEIASKEIVSFGTSFFVFDDYDDSHGSFYRYKISSDNGVYKLSETSRYNIETQISKEDLKGIQELIEKNDLAASNGIHSHTDGLPAEFETCTLSVTYTSGEKLSFSHDGDPYSPWMKDFRRYFNALFTAAGFEETAPDEEDYAIDYFTIEFNDGPLSYRYGTLDCLDKERLERSVWDMEKDRTVSENFASLEGGFLPQLSDLIEELDMQSLSGRHEQIEHTPDGYVDIYVSYMGDRTLYASFGPDSIPKEWESMRSVLQPFMDDYIEEYLEAGSYQELEILMSGSENSPVAVSYGFLYEFFAPDKDGRYDTYQNAVAAAKDDAARDKAAEAYYSGIADYVSDDLLETLKKTDALADFHRTFDSSAFSPEPGDLFVWRGGYEEYPEDAVNFDATFYGGEDSLTFSGWFIIEEIDGAYKLMRFEMLRSAPGN